MRYSLRFGSRNPRLCRWSVPSNEFAVKRGAFRWEQMFPLALYASKLSQPAKAAASTPREGNISVMRHQATDERYSARDPATGFDGNEIAGGNDRSIYGSNDASLNCYGGLLLARTNILISVVPVNVYYQTGCLFQAFVVFSFPL